MTDPTGAHRVVDPVTKAGYELVFQETFDGDTLDRARWLPHYLPQSSLREASAARYRLGDGTLRLVIEAERSAEICICEIFGRNVTAGRAGVGMGLHPFRGPEDPRPVLGRGPGHRRPRPPHLCRRVDARACGLLR
ncbi:MAG: hypothetical protein ACJ75N_22775 [Actinomycetes bacterium]